MMDWEKIRTGFVKDGLSWGRFHGSLRCRTARYRRGIKEDWPGQREEYLEENVGEKDEAGEDKAAAEDREDARRGQGA